MNRFGLLARSEVVSGTIIAKFFWTRNGPLGRAFIRLNNASQRFNSFNRH